MPGFDELQAVFDGTGANRHLALRLVAAGGDTARVAMPVRPELIQENGVVHGGYLSTLADTAAVYAVVAGLPADAGLTGIEFKMNFLRSGTAGGGEIEARSAIVRQGRSVAVVEVDVFQAETHLARGLFSYLLTAAGGRGRPAGSG